MKKHRGGYKKTTTLKVQTRINEVEAMMADGLSRRTIVKLGKQKWGVGFRQTDRYIRAIYDRWQKANIPTQKQNLQEAFARRNILYEKAMQDGDYRTALEVDKDIRKLQGLYVENIKHMGVMSFVDWVKQQEETNGKPDMADKKISGQEADGDQ